MWVKKSIMNDTMKQELIIPMKNHSPAPVPPTPVLLQPTWLPQQPPLFPPDQHLLPPSMQMSFQPPPPPLRPPPLPPTPLPPPPLPPGAPPTESSIATSLSQQLAANLEACSVG